MHSLITQKEERTITKEGSNCYPRATALPLHFALQHLRGEVVGEYQAVYTRYTESARVTKWPTSCSVVYKQKNALTF